MLHTVNHIKKKDVVQVMVGREKGKTGKVLRVIQKKGTVVIEKLNIMKRHSKATGQAQGGILEKEAPIQASNVLVFCDKCARGVRTAKKKLESGRTVRTCCRCKSEIDKIK